MFLATPDNPTGTPTPTRARARPPVHEEKWRPRVNPMEPVFGPK